MVHHSGGWFARLRDPTVRPCGATPGIAFLRKEGAPWTLLLIDGLAGDGGAQAPA